ncbi:hypothetical protein AC249_AIPGENE26649 [Exaiptasia diaphana]|nr:hypothetical protein AC249_AIPGENE26649 [Exaiptasia diaphana]
MMDVTDCSKAAALCMAGCCLAKKDKPNMAIAKLKEALSFDFDHLDALFHIAQQQQKLEEYDGEMKSLHYLCEALETQNKSNSIPICATSLLQGPFIPFVKSLYGKTISLEYARYWLGKRCLQLHRFSEASDALIDVVAAVTSDKFQVVIVTYPFTKH